MNKLTNMAKRKRVNCSKCKSFKHKKHRFKTNNGLIVGAVTIPITFGLLSKASSKLGDVGAGLEKAVPK